MPLPAGGGTGAALRWGDRRDDEDDRGEHQGDEKLRHGNAAERQRPEQAVLPAAVMARLHQRDANAGGEA